MDKRLYGLTFAMVLTAGIAASNFPAAAQVGPAMGKKWAETCLSERTKPAYRDSVQANETIRLDRHAGLIKLRAQLERDVEGITRLDLVARVALLELWCCPRYRRRRSRFST
jgi:hypothetical protein